jgi:hypothetical protein
MASVNSVKNEGVRGRMGNIDKTILEQSSLSNVGAWRSGNYANYKIPESAGQRQVGDAFVHGLLTSHSQAVETHPRFTLVAGSRFPRPGSVVGE